ncbi:MAG: hypothetical protein RI920_1438, partial [Pseudomonadota bacterium]
MDARLDDELERVRLRRIFDQGLDHKVGFALPVKREWSVGLQGPKWVTGPWFFRDERMYLIPGESPMGYRLPLDSLPWVSQGDYPFMHEHDPFAPRAPLADAAALRAQYGSHQIGGGFAQGGAVGIQGQGVTGLGGAAINGEWGNLAANPVVAAAGPVAATTVDPSKMPSRFESAHWITRTALCVEVRNPDRSSGPKVETEGDGGGVLYVFMPPLTSLDDYLDLVAAVEATAADLGMQIVMEGYPPPRDARLKLLQVTPDPGVIEVNIHPASSWEQLVDHTEFLYQAAHETRLSTEKFMVDGRHTGTGGGNHFVLGGATPGDSPFLRRPDLLASLLTFWHNHPSLSYLFSGMFIGPTSQAPRIDEARMDQVYETEIGLKEIERQMAIWGQCPPWMIDRTLRNLLVDATGNTHRSEFCIDKLYSPDGPTGRLGLLELRAFEMPPHAHMSLVQQLLLRALLAWFWKEPYEGHGAQRLTRWGTGLHDRFLLPSFVEQDFADVLTELRQAGFDFAPEWFAPHLEFRFPYIGEIATGGVRLTVRTALEPWHVMGEEGAPGGTVRYVDSSLERLEVKVTGLNGNRHVVTVNGQVLPLHPTGRVGEYVAGVRYRAWQPPSCLHPTIGSDAPLTIDLVDSWLKRSIGGCQYHVAHPGGRSYDTFPINAYEAESRRLSRFFRMGHTPGQMAVKVLPPGIEHPLTLDLRVAKLG